jgi:hypothetical protein
MNAERLHVIAEAVKADLESSRVVDLLQALTTALQNQVNQPTTAQYQQDVSQSLDKLERALLVSKAEEFGPTWRQVIEELGISKMLGRALLDRLHDIFSRNQITPAVALSELQVIQREITELSATLDMLLRAFRVLEIGSEDLDPGECEVGVLVPRAFVDNRLDKFAEELEEIDQIVGVFEEICTGSRPSPTIRTISSSDLSVYLDLAPLVGACVATCVERIVALYKQLLEIRKLKGDLIRQGLEAKALQGVDQHANKLMEDGINETVKIVIGEYASSGTKKERKNELEIELKFALKKIANRIDRGFNIEVRMETPGEEELEAEPEDAGADADKQAALLKSHQTIRAAASNMQFVHYDGEPILTLPEYPADKPAKK